MASSFWNQYNGSQYGKPFSNIVLQYNWINSNCRNQYTGITTKASGKIVKRGNNIEVGEMNIELDIDNIKYM